MHLKNAAQVALQGPPQAWSRLHTKRTRRAKSLSASARSESRSLRVSALSAMRTTLSMWSEVYVEMGSALRLISKSRLTLCAPLPSTKG